MAFYEWDENNQNSYTASEFEDVNSRENGFQPGTPISSIEMNTALKQATIVACALMDSLGITTDNLGTDRATLATDILTGLNQGRANITGSYIPNDDNTYYLGQNAKRWKGIYATNGTFNSLSATHGITAANGNIILSSSGDLTLAVGDIILNTGNISLTRANTKVKAPIIEDSTGTLQSVRNTVENQGMLINDLDLRLTALGFSSTTFTIAGSLSGNTIQRQGNYVYFHLSLGVSYTTSMLQNYFAIDKTLCTLPSGYRPKTNMSNVPVIMEQSGAYRSSLMTIGTDGKCIITAAGGESISQGGGWLYISFGFEAPPRS